MISYKNSVRKCPEGFYNIEFWKKTIQESLFGIINQESSSRHVRENHSPGKQQAVIDYEEYMKRVGTAGKRHDSTVIEDLKVGKFTPTPFSSGFSFVIIVFLFSGE